ncbi:MAG TPA: signal peptidase II [Patescibacteria group bacterium]|nr:signal peptidase II [Patescibacteria group bacterium]
MSSDGRFYTRMISGAIFAYGIDRLTKYLALYYLQQPHIIIPNILQLEFLGNTHFLFYWKMPAIIVFGSVGIVMMLMIYWGIKEYKAKQRISVVLLLLILTGACSNILDRIKYGYVIDFINVPFWSVFNIADVYIVIGVFLLIITNWKNEQHAIIQKVSTDN